MTKLFLNRKKVLVKVYDGCKYKASSEKAYEVTYDYCTGFEVATGAEAKEIEAHTDGTCIDDYHEYLTLFFEDGTEVTFRNSYVDIFALS